MGDTWWPGNADIVHIGSLLSSGLGLGGLPILREAIEADPEEEHIGSILTRSRVGALGILKVAIALLLLVARVKVNLGLSCYSGKVSVYIGLHWVVSSGQ